jgi:SAM-dependent methyltransferase
MTTEQQGQDVDWSQEAEHLIRSLRRDEHWLAEAAAVLTPGRRTLLDYGCGAGGMAIALAEAAPDATVIGVDGEPVLIEVARRAAAERGGPAADNRYERIRFEDGRDALAAVIGTRPDLIWASAVVHHIPDQQGAVDDMAALLAPGGRIALSEGGLPMRFLPWDLGLGRPGLESRMEDAQHARLVALRAGLPGTVPMPYGWQDVLRRAGLVDVTSRSFLMDRQAAPGSQAMGDVLHTLGHQAADLTESGLLDAEDAEVWRRLLDEDGPHWLGRRTDVYQLTARVVHFGDRAEA